MRNARLPALTSGLLTATLIAAASFVGCSAAVRIGHHDRAPFNLSPDTTAGFLGYHEMRQDPAKVDASEGDHPGIGLTRPPPAMADSFPHARHVTVQCLVCHQTGAGHGRLTFERPSGCAACHHQAQTPARCASCHRTEKYGAPKHMTVTVTVPGRPPNPRPVDFLHERHVTRTCVECHTTPVTLALAPKKAQCKDCHSEHHGIGRTCSACHTLAEPKAEHRTRDAAHERCDACHTATTIALLTPTRSFCSTCHTAKAKNHYDQKECSVCHFLAEPGAYRSKLVTPPPQ